MQQYKINGKQNMSLPRAVYNQCVWVMKDYDRLLELAEMEADSDDGSVVFYANEGSGLMPEAVVSEAKAKIEAINRALSEVPEVFRLAVFEFFAHNTKMPDDAAVNTWKKWKKTFIKSLARELNLF